MTDIRDYRSEFPILEHKLFLNHAGVSPISRRAHAAIENHNNDVLAHGPLRLLTWVDVVEKTRDKVAALLGAAPKQVALTKATTEGINIVANGFRFQQGDNVVIPGVEYPANVYPWWNQERRGVELRLVPERDDGTVPLEDIAAKMDDRTRIVSVSYVQFASGYRMDLEALGKLCRERGAYLFVDAIQALGVFPVDVGACNIAALTCGAHKWILGPTGAAFFYCRPDLMDELDPVLVGADAVEGWLDYLDYDFTLKPDATRFEYAMMNYGGIYGMHAALELVEEVGIHNIRDRVKELTDHLATELANRGWSVYSSRAGEAWSGILSLVPPDGDAEAMRKKLFKAGIVTNTRADRLRVSPHYYNNEEDVEKLFEAVG